MKRVLQLLELQSDALHYLRHMCLWVERGNFEDAMQFQLLYLVTTDEAYDLTFQMSQSEWKRYWAVRARAAGR